MFNVQRSPSFSLNPPIIRYHQRPNINFKTLLIKSEQLLFLIDVKFVFLWG